MIQIKDKRLCSGCHACATACPKNCITMVRDDEGFLYPRVEENRCVHCVLCEKSCPILTPAPNRLTEADQTAYAAYSKDEEIRLASSSGGLFTEIASYVIKNGGVVFGAAFDPDFQVVHIAAETLTDIKKLRGSKYVQSTIGMAYKDAKEYLQAGRTVLFSGTPCQIGGLHSYLGKDYENLISADIICHGVPSPMIWEKYLNETGKPRAVQFRNKTLGWRNYSLYIKTDKKCIQESRYKNAMIKVFLKNLCLRPSCHSCAFKGPNRKSDMTLADFWGIQNIYPDMDDDKGTSLVIANTEKAKRVLEEIAPQIVQKEADLSLALKSNRSYDCSAACPDTRAQFMAQSREKRITQLASRYCRDKWIIRLKRTIKNMMGR